MDRYLYEIRCKCKEEFSIIKKRKSTPRSEGKPFLYPDSTELKSKTFQIKYKKTLSPIAKILLNGFQKKYLFYAMDDILYFLKLNQTEQNNLLAIIYSPIISLQNNLSVNFFDIWIHELYITETTKTNKFLIKNSENLESFTYITLKLFYKTRTPLKKQEPLW